MRFTIFKLNKIFYFSMAVMAMLLFNFCKSSTKQSNQEHLGAEVKSASPPNVVIIFLDDSGYGDFQPFGDGDLKTPHVAQLAQEGVTFTNFHVPQAICSASRAALLTGCYPGRTKVFGAHGPKERGLETSFPTMGEVFKKAGYTTALFGKWHCGDQPDTRPHARGFDETCGLMYSNDMWKHHPENPEYWGKFPIQFWENGKVTIEDVSYKEQKQLTKWYTEHVVDFINSHKEKPFLLYVPHSMPHVPIFASEAFEGKSGKGLYADVLLELDWSVGQITKALKSNGLDDNTVVVFTSDNGPWVAYGNHAGVTPFREAKSTSFEGGTRSACIIKYPKKLEADMSSNKAFMSIDLLPTLAKWANVDVSDLEIDGKDVTSWILGESTENPNAYYAFSTGKNFESIMTSDGEWKLHLNHSYRRLEKAGKDGLPGAYETKEIDLSLFNLNKNPKEDKNVILEQPEITATLKKFAIEHQNQFYSED